jgi:tetratricopeptide (TPR) repeat protein
LANLKKSQEKIEEAKTLYLKSIEINPNFLEAQVNLGALFYSSGDNEKAESYYKRAIEINPNSSIALQNISNIYIARLDNFEKAIYSSNKALKIDIASQPIRNKISFFRLKHSVEQAKHLSSKNYQIEGLDEFQKMGDEILNRKENIQIKNIRTKKILLNAEEINNLMPFFKSDYVYQTKKISGSCINPNKNWLAVEEEYLNSSNQIIYIDNFLSDEALIELREFCLVSKVWNREYLNKYLGAFSDSGFISKIHLQIATDLKKKLPKLFGPHSLSKFWAFKYDSTLGQGINVHADFATHNLNFWITPDEFNNNKNSGGLKVYDVAAPDNWTFSDYNNNSEKIYKFLKDESANCINIPYKFNRAVLFNSSYFHETDEIDFKDVYEGRRINNTFLFGNRQLKVKNK